MVDLLKKSTRSVGTDLRWHPRPVAIKSVRPYHSAMPKRPRKPKPQDPNVAADRIVQEVTKERSEEPINPPPAAPRNWSAPTEEETPPPKIS